MKTALTVALMVFTAGILTGCGGSNSSTSAQKVSAEATKMIHASGTVAADYQNAVQEMYVAYFGRPADPTGLVNFENALLTANAPTDIQGLNAAYNTNPAIQSLLNNFSTSAESKALYGGGNTAAFVSAIYQNVLGRTPAPNDPGAAWWVNAITNGGLTQGNAALSIMAGALVNTSAQGVLDGELINNRIAAASDFTAAVPVLTYVGNDAASNARAMLSTVTSTTDLTSFQSTIANTIVTISNQEIFESFALNGGESTVFANFPYGGGNMVPGANYIYASSFNVLSQSPLNSSAQLATAANTTLDSLLVAQSAGNVRVLQGGAILLQSSLAQRLISYVGSQIQVQALATDGVTVIRTTRFSNYSSTPLAGQMVNSPEELFAALPINLWINYNNFSVSAQWKSGAAYIKKQGAQVGDYIMTQDCTNTANPVYTTGTSVTPCQTNTTLDNFFPISLLGGANAYPLETEFSGDGSISMVQGLRMWVANAPIPPGSDSTATYRVYYEMNGNVYMGTMVKDGTAFMYPQADGSAVNYSLTLNQIAVNSVQQGVITGAIVAGTQAGFPTTVQAPDLFGIGGTGVNGALSPADLRTHYNIPATLTGAGQTVAIVDAPGTGNVADDLNVYSQFYNLPACTTANSCFRHIDLSNGASITAKNDFGSEIELDTQMVHAIAPAAKIILVTASSRSSADLTAAVNYAAALPGVTAVSMSYTGANYSATQESQFAAFQSSGGPVFFASSGDDANYSTPLYPASSLYVTSVGGTTINAVNWISTASETAWQYSGGGINTNSLMPAWQSAALSSALIGANGGQRAVPDVAAVADPQRSAVSIYYKDAWSMAGGTSAAAPIWAGIGALLAQSLANQNKSLSQLTSSTPGGFNGLLYQIAPTAGAFYDIVSGSNNLTVKPCAICSAIPGYDDVTGLGAPNVAVMAANLGVQTSP